jgi:hypothetical protein
MEAHTQRDRKPPDGHATWVCKMEKAPSSSVAYTERIVCQPRAQFVRDDGNFYSRGISITNISYGIFTLLSTQDYGLAIRVGTYEEASRLLKLVILPPRF